MFHYPAGIIKELRNFINILYIEELPGFIWAKSFEGKTGGRAGLMGHLGNSRGGKHTLLGSMQINPRLPNFIDIWESLFQWKQPVNNSMISANL